MRREALKSIEATGMINHERGRDRQREIMLDSDMEEQYRQNRSTTPGIEISGKPWVPIPFSKGHEDDDKSAMKFT